MVGCVHEALTARVVFRARLWHEGFETKERAKGEGEVGAPRSSTGPTRRVHDLRFFGAAGELQVDTLRWDIPIHVVAVGPVARASLHPPIHRLKFAAS